MTKGLSHETCFLIGKLLFRDTLLFGFTFLGSLHSCKHVWMCHEGQCIEPVEESGKGCL